MGDADLWRADGSFRGIQSAGGKGSGGGKGGGKGGGPQFTRVIPKFLQKFHEPPAIQAKFAAAADGDDEDAEAEELDDVQQAAIAEFLAKEQATGGESIAEDAPAAADAKPQKPKKPAQTVAGVGGRAQQAKRDAQQAPDETKQKKRKRAEAATLSNKKLLSFSMDDDE